MHTANDSKAYIQHKSGFPFNRRLASLVCQEISLDTRALRERVLHLVADIEFTVRPWLFVSASCIPIKSPLVRHENSIRGQAYLLFL